MILALLVLAVSGAAYYVSFLRERTSPFGDSDRPTEPWNILLISLDTTRPDYLAACASGPVATPSLDRIAGGGFVLSSMISPAPITLPSHASLLTGLNPNRHGVRENTEYALPDDAITAAETFRSHGYRTQAFVSAFVMDGRFGLEQGFGDYVDDLTAPSVRPGAVELPGAVSTSRAAEWISAHATARRRGDETRPFFLFLHLFDAHAPYAPPSPYRESYPSDPYAGELAYQDAVLGAVLDRLEVVGEADRTLIWVVSDHGESLGAHGEDTHSLFVYDVTQRIVSLLRLPPANGRYETGAPRLVADDVTGIVDVYPTLLDLMGIAPPGSEATAGLDGQSLVPLLRGESDPERAIYCETWSPYVSYRWAPLEAVRTKQWKYIRAPFPELYDLVSDPNEETNLAAAKPDVVRDLSNHLDTFIAGASGGTLAAGATRAASEEELERLRSLGYLGNAGTPSPGDVDFSKLPDPKRQVAFFRGPFQSAKSLLLSGRVDEAIAKFEDARSADPGNPSVHQFLGVAYRQAGEFRDAADSYRTALALQPDSPRSWVGMGRAQMSLGHPDSARTAFVTARTLLPHSPDSWEGLGDLAWEAGDVARAATLLDSARVLGAPPILIEGKLARLYRDDFPDAARASRHLEAYARALGTNATEAARRLPPSPLR
ncbi:MAG: sulfatase-like hydrolase/transferase [Candidatus Eisenbacteria bacterium]|uniref:Sulfatase-like hydrolase/transferase n=1 Tax=Eiseniibacteriota bacterium TaxID=2212470 RepID=A0A956NA37_UNCEI|nr:sulfatase-like hydrolase/transferase [Candidatus Eisenbacteria bacterium]